MIASSIACVKAYSLTFLQQEMTINLNIILRQICRKLHRKINANKKTDSCLRHYIKTSYSAWYKLPRVVIIYTTFIFPRWKIALQCRTDFVSAKLRFCWEFRKCRSNYIGFARHVFNVMTNNLCAASMSWQPRPLFRWCYRYHIQNKVFSVWTYEYVLAKHRIYLCALKKIDILLN